jgi:hypothetical protein
MSWICLLAGEIMNMMSKALKNTVTMIQASKDCDHECGFQVSSHEPRKVQTGTLRRAEPSCREKSADAANVRTGLPPMVQSQSPTLAPR